MNEGSSKIVNEILIEFVSELSKIQGTVADGLGLPISIIRIPEGAYATGVVKQLLQCECGVGVDPIFSPSA